MSNSTILPISLVIVSDFELGPKSWQDEDTCLRRCLADEDGIPSDVVIAASSRDKETPAPDWSDCPVPIKLVFVDSEASGEIKNAATGHTQHDLVAVVEADCFAVEGWLNGLYQTFLQNPDADIVTGLTSYAPTTAMRRVAALYDRGYLHDRRADGYAIHVSVNGALYKKELLEAFPFGSDISPFVSGHRRNDAFHDAGVRIVLARDAVQYHEYGGWPFIVDVRKNKGLQYQIMQGVGQNRTSGRLQTVRENAALFCRGVRADLRMMRRLFGEFCKPRDLPLAIIFPFVARALELRGAALGRRGYASVPGTAYR